MWCVRVWDYLWRIWKEMTMTLFIFTMHSLTTQLFNHLIQSLVFFFYVFDISFWHQTQWGAIVHGEMWHYLSEKPMVIHQMILSVDGGVWPSVHLMMLLSLTVSLFSSVSSCECVYESLRWNVFWFSAVFVCYPLCWMNEHFLNTVMFKGVMNSH